jgi:hypothetical protein
MTNLNIAQISWQALMEKLSALFYGRKNVEVIEVNKTTDEKISQLSQDLFAESKKISEALYYKGYFNLHSTQVLTKSWKQSFIRNLTWLLSLFFKSYETKLEKDLLEFKGNYHKELKKSLSASFANSKNTTPRLSRDFNSLLDRIYIPLIKESSAFDALSNSLDKFHNYNLVYDEKEKIKDIFIKRIIKFTCYNSNQTKHIENICKKIQSEGHKKLKKICNSLKNLDQKV